MPPLQQLVQGGILPLQLQLQRLLVFLPSTATTTTDSMGGMTTAQKRVSAKAAKKAQESKAQERAQPPNDDDGDWDTSALAPSLGHFCCFGDTHMTSSSMGSSKAKSIHLTHDDYSPAMNEAAMRIFRLSTDEFKRMSFGSQTRYIYISAAGRKVEPLAKLSKRTEMLEWMLSCLRKGKEKGPFSHLAEQVNRYDVAGLYTSILESVDVQNPFIFWRAFEKFVNLNLQRQKTFLQISLGSKRWSLD